MIIDFFQQLLSWIITLLPKSPFIKYINALDAIPYLKYLNWFFPVTECIGVMEAFCAVVAVWYVYQAILRYLQMIK